MNNNSSGDLSKILGSAITSVSGVIGDVKNQINEKIENYLTKMDLVKREEFDLLKSMLAEIRIEQEIIKKKLQDLETK